MSKKKVALVLSTGGVRGFGHIGAIEEIVNAGFKISAIAGSSMGALIGAAYAYGNIEACNELMLVLNKHRFMDLVDFSFSRQGIIKGNKVMRIFSKIVPDVAIEDLPLPLSIVTTDINNNKEFVFKEGSLHNAIRASISLPLIFIPYEYNFKRLIDGGIINPLPINHVKRTEGDIIIACIAGAINKYSEINSALGKQNILMKSLTVMVQQIIQLNIEKYKPDLVIELPGSSYSIFNFNKARELIRIGKIHARNAIEVYNT
ncbi:patatin-like phospholipase family protein [Saccharicrinis aurantiacus]|uniref:patatin-like phospholipase family protein n=1 Tax=Saccharicrinis aurantiacus TaxID=1849719 RepID=UPI00094F7865|nr:patatin-like phospholipase family protein [Saccharicrinis aurantiacus]